MVVCRNYGKVRNKYNEWIGRESHFNENPNNKLSRSICPQCAKNLYPDLVAVITPNID